MWGATYIVCASVLMPCVWAVWCATCILYARVLVLGVQVVWGATCTVQYSLCQGVSARCVGSVGCHICRIC